MFFADKILNKNKFVIHSAENGKAKLNAFGEFIDSKRHFNINFTIECFNLNIPYIFEAQFLSPFHPSLNEEKFMPLLINYSCFCYKWVNDFVVSLELIDEECFLINYKNAFNKSNCNIIQNVKESKERALNVKQDFVKMTWRTTDNQKKSLLKKLLKWIKDVWNC